MMRPALDTACASDEEIRKFLQRWRKVTGKRNSVAGEGFQIYTDNGTDMVRQIRADGVDILEPYIRQHPAYQAIYPDSLNTLRIHTVRSSKGVRIFLTTILSVGGDGSKTDVSRSTTRYRVLLSEDGSILQAFRQDPGGPCLIAERHHNTGYPFRHGRKLPGIPACLECCRKAAFYIPEMRFIGWDVAYTENGPVIVEANNLSASFYTYQQAKECIGGAGVRDEVEEMLAFGMEGVRYNEDTIYVSEPLTGVGTPMPGRRRLYLILLQSALHRHGVEFYDREFIKRKPAAIKKCSIRFPEEKNDVLIKGHPGISEEEFFALDQIAMQEAARIYRELAQVDVQEVTL
jgi:hypothetical protein